ncbi:hypothetical protein M404DRAFT_685448 [Pisolithus tinctorius Marx 270]|uniref:Uncharacterized protein n=1 Tax=Pisolithus tinctorius Marx 270 TaxID=870435 RepID=A0A0C3PUU4_PISTI|nr:hypothetical protein M404DRAFT_685448 [Pisolithus tinctorius Marx 270]
MTENSLRSDPAESSKAGYKFYAFFRSRSRSRSRSKSVTPTSIPPPMLSKVEAISITQTQSLSSRRPRLSTEHIPPNIPPSSYMSSPTKSIGRSQSRPISSTTTATHSTIAPLPSDALRKTINGRQEIMMSTAKTANTTIYNNFRPDQKHPPLLSGSQLAARPHYPLSARHQLRLWYPSPHGTLPLPKTVRPFNPCAIEPTASLSEPTPPIVWLELSSQHSKIVCWSFTPSCCACTVSWQASFCRCTSDTS